MARGSRLLVFFVPDRDQDIEVIGRIVMMQTGGLITLGVGILVLAPA